jgi:multiple sugar transport system substrate-binding protein
MEPEALEAMRAYFSLYHYVPEGALGFAQRNVAAIMAGPWMLQAFANQGIPDEDLKRIGIAVPPGPPFVGGTVLSIWQHASYNRRVDDALKFVEFMSQSEVQVEYCPHLGLLPTREDAWEIPAIADNPYYKVMRQALSVGRSLPSVPLWGMVEEKLKGGISQIWGDLLTNPDADVDRAIQRYLEPVVTRLNLSLK